MIEYIKQKSEIFYRELLYPRHFRIIIIIYITLKITGKLFYNESYLSGLKSGVIGILIYWLAMYAINLGSTSNNEQINKRLISTKASKGNSKQELVIARRGLFISILYTFFLFLLVFDNLQRRNLITGHPLMSYVPGYDIFLSLLKGLSQNISELADFLLQYQIQNIIIFAMFLILIPYLLFRLLGYSFKGLFSIRNSYAALPILGLSIVLFMNGGLKGYWTWNFVYAILYPTLGEAFFHRGIVYRSAARSIKNPTTAMVVSAGVLCLLYFPDIYYRLCASSITLCMSRMGDIFLHGLFMAYAYRKTDTIMPWILIHALTSTIYF